jgi:TATA-binding protein-associated factor Taf7
MDEDQPVPKLSQAAKRTKAKGAKRSKRNLKSLREPKSSAQSFITP